MFSFETGQMSAVETGQMSAAETGQMSAVETRQMSSVARTDICLVSTHNVEVSEVCTVPMFKSQKYALCQCSSLRSLNCGNVTMFKSQIGGLALNPRNCFKMGPEWSPGPENRPPSMPRHILASGTGPAAQVDPKSARVGPESAQDTCRMTAVIPQVWDDSTVRLGLSSHLKQRYAFGVLHKIV